MNYKNKKWFTLIEILLWITIFSIVIVWGFFALVASQVWTVKLIEEVDITKEAFYFSEKFFDEIKRGWTLDYEEYFNRMVVWTWTTNGHFNAPTWFGNFGKGSNLTAIFNWTNGWAINYWAGIYYCRSLDGIPMWTNWCYKSDWSNDFSSTSTWAYFWSELWDPQRFWQYAFQFIDYNSNASWTWDHNLNWTIIWDDDDENLWLGPVLFMSWENVKEIYLISRDQRKRTLFRWNIIEDPFEKPSSATCVNWTWSWCLWTIEFLRLDWEDWGVYHDISNIDSNWVVDTWIIDNDFIPWDDRVIAWTNEGHFKSSRCFNDCTDYYWIWQPLFPDTINVKNFEVYAYPNIDRDYSWRDNSVLSNVNPYLQIKLTLAPSWKKRAQMRWEMPIVEISTTINLSEYFSR